MDIRSPRFIPFGKSFRDSCLSVFLATDYGSSGTSRFFIFWRGTLFDQGSTVCKFGFTLAQPCSWHVQLQRLYLCGWASHTDVMPRHSVSFAGCRLASLDDIRSFDLPVRTRDVKATLRRNVYDGDGTYVNTELTIRSWSVLRRWKPFPPPWGTTRPIRPLPRMHVLQGRSTIDPSTNRRSSSRKIVEYDEIASPRESADWLWKRGKEKLSTNFPRYRKRDAGRTLA